MEKKSGKRAPTSIMNRRLPEDRLRISDVRFKYVSILSKSKGACGHVPNAKDGAQLGLQRCTAPRDLSVGATRFVFSTSRESVMMRIGCVHIHLGPWRCNPVPVSNRYSASLELILRRKAALESLKPRGVEAATQS